MSQDTNLHSMELKISTFLRFGVALSGILLLTGWMMNISWNEHTFFVFQDYDQIPLQNLIRHYIVRENWGALTVYAGLATLISLPVIRVFLTMCLFMKQKEWQLAGITALVLTGLIVSFTFGIEL